MPGSYLCIIISEDERTHHVGTGGRWHIPEDHEPLRPDALDLQPVLAAS
jgi:hypothetical protein